MGIKYFDTKVVPIFEARYIHTELFFYFTIAINFVMV